MDNDQLIAVPEKSQSYADVKELSDFPESTVSEIEHFFVSYNKAVGKTFKVTGQGSAAQARKLVEEGMTRSEKKTKSTGRAK